MQVVIFTDVRQTGYLKYAGPYRIATELRSAGFTVQVVDYLTRWSTVKLKSILNKFVTEETLWVGFTTTFNSKDKGRINRQIPISILQNVIGRIDAIEIIDHIKSINHQTKIVVGGAKARLLSLESKIDHVVLDQGETASIAITNSLLKKEKLPKLLTNSSYPYNNFSTSTIEYIPEDIIFQGEHLPIEIARGCIFKCSFCNYPLNGKKMWEFVKSPDLVANEMQRNYDLFKTQGYLISDDTLNDSVEKIEALHNSISKLQFDLTLSAYARLDLIISHPHTLDLMYEMGLRSFFFGIETLNHDAGKAIGKGMHPNKIKQGLENIKKKYPDMLLSAGFIMGLPNETKESALETIEYFKSSPLDNISVSPLYLNPESAIAKESSNFQYEIISPTDWSNPNMNYKDAEYFTKQANEIVKPNNKLSWWFLNRMMNLGYSLEYCATHTFKDNVDITKQKMRQLMDNYYKSLMNL